MQTKPWYVTVLTCTVVLLQLCSGAGAASSGCSLQEMASLPLETDSQDTVAASLEGREGSFVVDTGMPFSSVTSESLAMLIPRSTDQSAEPPVAPRVVLLHHLKFGPLSLQEIRMSVREIIRNPSNPRSMLGIIGENILHMGEFELDHHDHEIKFFGDASCDDPNPDWSGSFQRITLQLNRDQLPMTTVFLDNHPVVAIIDTGSDRTVIKRASAERTILTDQGVIPMNESLSFGESGEGSGQFYRIKSLTVGVESTKDFPVFVDSIPINGADMLLGLDYLKVHRLVFLTTKRQLLIDR